MIILPDTNTLLQLITTVAGSVDYSTSYVDLTSITFVANGTQGNISTAGSTNIVLAPAAATQRQIKLITVRNRSTSVSTVVTLQRYNGTTAVAITGDVVLVPGEVLEYVDGIGFSVLDPFLRSKQASSGVDVVGNTPVSNPVVMAGVDTLGQVRRASLDLTGKVAVRLPQTDAADQSLPEMLMQIAGSLRASVYVLTQILAVSRGQFDPPTGEEADPLIGEFTNPLTPYTNLTN